MIGGQNHGAGSATILSFPKGGRAAVAAKLRRDRYLATLENDNRTPKQMVITDAWYHQAAMEDERKPS